MVPTLASKTRTLRGSVANSLVSRPESIETRSWHCSTFETFESSNQAPRSASTTSYTEPRCNCVV